MKTLSLENTVAATGAGLVVPDQVPQMQIEGFSKGVSS